MSNFDLSNIISWDWGPNQEYIEHILKVWDEEQKAELLKIAYHISEFLSSFIKPYNEKVSCTEYVRREFEKKH